MLRYTAPERGILLTIYLTNNRSVTLAQREFRRRFPGRPTPIKTASYFAVTL